MTFGFKHFQQHNASKLMKPLFNEFIKSFK